MAMAEPADAKELSAAASAVDDPGATTKWARLMSPSSGAGSLCLQGDKLSDETHPEKKEKLEGTVANALQFHVKASAKYHRAESRKLADGDDDENDTPPSAHGGHHEKAPSIFTAVPAAIINYLLMFGLCCAYGLIMFPDSWHAQHQRLAVKMNLSTALITGLILGFTSKVKCAIGGPDLNPVVFLGMFVESIAGKLAEKNGLDYPNTERRLYQECAAAFMDMNPSEALRRMAAGTSDDEFCTGEHKLLHKSDCEKYHEELIATTIFATAVATACLSIIFFGLGRLRLTKFVNYVPTNIMEAFLSCVGYKVFFYGLKFCKFQPKMFIPAACIGVPMYFAKAMHIGNPAIVLPAMLLFPLGIFYGVLYATGGDLDSARDAKWMFEEMKNADFWELWIPSEGESLFHYENISFAAWAASLPDLPVMIIVVVLDCMLKLSSTESKLPVKAEKNYEVQLYGAANFLNMLCGSSPGYMQLKFNVINFGVMGNANDRRGSILYALLCGVSFFGTTYHFNYLPRFFLSTLLFFAGAGFIAENLWGSRRYLTTWEWLQVLLILAVFIIWGSLLVAVIAGFLLVGVHFIVVYAGIPPLMGKPFTGGELVSRERRSLVLQCTIQQLSNTWLLVFKLKGFLFWASADQLCTDILQTITSQLHRPKYKRTVQFVFFDGHHLDGMDSSAGKALARLLNQATACGVQIKWSGLTPERRADLEAKGVIRSPDDCFTDLNEAAHWVEQEIIGYLVKNQKKWLELNQKFKFFHEMVEVEASFDPFKDVFTTDATRLGFPWNYCGRQKMQAYVTVLWAPGQLHKDLFLLHRGRVGVFDKIPQVSSKGHMKSEWTSPIAIYGPGRFLNRQTLSGISSNMYAIALDDGECVTWSRRQWHTLTVERPHMATAILSMALQQEAVEAEQQIQQGNMYAAHEIEDDLQTRMDRRSKELQDVKLQELVPWLRGVMVAHKVARLGLYGEVGPDGHLPDIPVRAQEALSLAFDAYSRNGRLLKSEVAEALMYAGVFHTMLSLSELSDLSREEFVALGHEATMMRLSRSQDQLLRAMFQRHAKGAEAIDAEEVHNIFTAKFHHYIPWEEVVGLVVTFQGDARQLIINEDMFVAMVSRFLRRNAHFWLLLTGVQDLLGVEELQEDHKITVAKMVTNGQGTKKITKEAAEELLWARFDSDETVDDNDSSNQETCDWQLLVGVVAFAQVAPFPLPPPPKAKEAQRSLDDSDAPRSARNSDALRNSDAPRSAASDRGTYEVEEEEAQAQAGPQHGSGSNGGEELANQDASASTADGAETKRDMRKFVTDFRGIAKGDVPKGELGRKTENLATAPTQVDMSMEIASTTTEEQASSADAPSCRLRLHRLLEDPESGKYANILSVIMAVMIMVSVLTLFAEPLVSPEEEQASDAERSVWSAFEYYFTGLFTIELLLRFLVTDAGGTQTQWDFIKSPMNICDAVAVLPLYIELIFHSESAEFRLLRVARLLRLSRVVRLGRLAKKSATVAPIAVILVVIWGIYLKVKFTTSD